jgi:hypothetical protein
MDIFGECRDGLIRLFGLERTNRDLRYECGSIQLSVAVVRSRARTCSMGPAVTMIRATTAVAEWKPLAQLMMSRTRPLVPSWRPLLMPSQTAARTDNTQLRIIGG